MASLKTEYIYESDKGATITVIIETNVMGSLFSESTFPERIIDHVESIYKITNCPKAPTDKEMEEMEKYFSESDDE